MTPNQNKLDFLRKERHEVWNESRMLLNASQNRSLTIDETVRLDAALTVMDAYDSKLRAVLAEPDPQELRVDKFGRSVCACGYAEECGVWCGNGHETGECGKGGGGGGGEYADEYNPDTFVPDMNRIEQSLQSGVYTKDEARAALPNLNDVHLPKDMSMSRKKLAEVDRRRHAAEVARFQKEHGLLADGIIGIRTMSKLNEEDARRLEVEFAEKMKSREPMILSSSRTAWGSFSTSSTDYFRNQPITGATVAQTAKPDPNAYGPKTRDQVDAAYEHYLKLYVEYGEEQYLEQMLECVYMQ